jgi:hypothetical protein
MIALDKRFAQALRLDDIRKMRAALAEKSGCRSSISSRPVIAFATRPRAHGRQLRSDATRWFIDRAVEAVQFESDGRAREPSAGAP